MVMGIYTHQICSVSTVVCSYTHLVQMVCYCGICGLVSLHAYKAGIIINKFFGLEEILNINTPRCFQLVNLFVSDNCLV
jgi:hypothetical protein